MDGRQNQKLQEQLKVSLPLCLCLGALCMNEETAQNETHIKLRAFGRNLFSPGSQLTARAGIFPSGRTCAMAFCPFPASASFLERKQSAGATTATNAGNLVLKQPTTGLEHVWAAVVVAVFYITLSAADFLVMFCWQEMHRWYLLESTK